MPDPIGFPKLAFDLLIMAGYATLFFRAAKVENIPAIPAGLLSIAVYLWTWMVWGWGFWGNLLAQAVLFVALGVAKGLYVHRQRRPRKKKKRALSKKRA